ncbi:MAG TPA: CPBP family intramembrane metalloprotease [candidate division Zixibacteria bacterium]|nr:CPBP family intramembrane metalloprotease [candidate division Zixibacteria bacterium]
MGAPSRHYCSSVYSGYYREVIFRGYALTRLKRCIPIVWLILSIIAISFVFIHGEVRSLGQFSNYAIFSFVFGTGFI